MKAALQSLGRGDRGLLAPLAQLIGEAGAVIQRFAATAAAAREKADRSPVTDADEAAEAILRAGLARLLPGVPVIAEEAVARGDRSIPGSTFLLVDPLDGTREFIAGRSEYAVNIALIAEQMPALGMIYAPALNTLYAAAEGRALRAALAPGAPFDPKSAVAIRARPRPRRLTALVSRSHLDPATVAFLDGLPIERRIALGSSLKFARIAEGAADVYARLARVSEWDVAAGHALLTAAGGSVTAPDGGALAYGKLQAGYRVDGFVAWGAAPED
jgi:3'(2'), 5'-bisphosphate nucleotidase